MGYNDALSGVFFKQMAQSLRLKKCMRLWLNQMVAGLLVIVLSLCMRVPVAAAQTAEEMITRIEAAIKVGDATGIAVFFGDRVEITIAERAEVFSKNQAQYVLKEFFMNYPIRNFSLMSKGSTENTYYAVGSYVSDRGAFDANVFIKKQGNTLIVDHLRFGRSIR
jgi:hypothetical protein